jgi:serine/threonine protein kinase
MAVFTYEIQFCKRFGRGTAGTFYLAKWSGPTVDAVKVAALSEMGLKGWRSKVQTLQRLHHSNVIRLLGSVYNENPLTCYC